MSKNSPIHTFVCIVLLTTFTVVPIDANAKDPCRRATRGIVNMATKLTKIADLMVAKIYKQYNKKATTNFLSRADAKKLDDQTGKRNQIQASIDYAENTCGSINTYCPWTCWNAQWPMPTECRQCWFEYDGSPTGCDYSYRQTVLGWIKDRDRLNKSIDKIGTKQVKLEEKTKNRVRKKCQKGAGSEAKAIALMAECSVSATWNRPPTTPFGEACWPN